MLKSAPLRVAVKRSIGMRQLYLRRDGYDPRIAFQSLQGNCSLDEFADRGDVRREVPRDLRSAVGAGVRRKNQRQQKLVRGMGIDRHPRFPKADRLIDGLIGN